MLWDVGFRVFQRQLYIQTCIRERIHMYTKNGRRRSICVVVGMLAVPVFAAQVVRNTCLQLESWIIRFVYGFSRVTDELHTYVLDCY